MDSVVYTDEERARRRRRRSSTQTAAKPRRRKRRRRNYRIDLIFLAMLAVVILIVIVWPRGQQEQDPTTVGTTEGTAEPTTTAPTTVVTEPPIVPVSISASDVELLYARPSSICHCDYDMESALTQPLDWDMTADNFTVLIIHSHISESYTKTDDQDYSYKGGDPYRTDNEAYNMVAIGERVAEILRAGGINVIHDTTSHEHPNSDYAYTNAEEHLEQVLADNPDIQMIIDLHRDAVENSDGTQWAPTVTVNGEETAMLSLLVGTGCRYDGNPYWEQQLGYITKLGVVMERMVPGIYRQIYVSHSHYNHAMHPMFFLTEIGTAGNTLEEALNAAELLAEGILELAHGVVIE